MRGATTAVRTGADRRRSSVPVCEAATAPRLALAHPTALELDPPALIEVAHSAGCVAVGLRATRITPHEPHHRLCDDATLRRRTLEVARSLGVAIHNVENARLGPDSDPLSYAPLVRTAAELGAESIVVQAPDPDRERAVERLGRIADLAAAHGLRCELEFVAWTEVADLSTALTLVRQVGRPSLGVLVDVLHFNRSGSSLAELREVPAELLRLAHLNDVRPLSSPTPDDLADDARHHRQLPGDGCADVASIVAALPASTLLAVEIPNDEGLRQWGAEGWARRAVEASRDIVLGASR